MSLLLLQVLTQDATELDVIVRGQIQMQSITSREYLLDMSGVAVMTRVPINLFSFRVGKTITVTGQMKLQLAGGNNGRKLKLFAEDGSSTKTITKSSYDFKVDPWCAFVQTVARSQA